MHHVQQMPRNAFYYFVMERISQVPTPMEGDPLAGKELRRLLDLQPPQWTLIAPTSARFNRSLAVEEAIAEVDNQAGNIWPFALGSSEGNHAGEKVTITLPDRKRFRRCSFLGKEGVCRMPSWAVSRKYCPRQCQMYS
jgi:hypothetical protein